MNYRKSSAVAVSVLVSCLLTPANAAWDITKAHGPSKQVDFTVTEGTWMNVSVSPDGEMLLFDLLGDIYALPAEGGTARVVHDGPAMQIMPTFGPEGRRMAYLSDASGGDNIWTSAADGSDPEQITNVSPNLVTTPVWGPDSNYWVAVQTYSRAEKTGHSELRLFHHRGGKGRLLVEKPNNGTTVFEPEMSPDGRYLYYTERVTELHDSHIFIDPNHVNYAIMRRDLQTGETEQLLAGFGSATTPQVSPDGRRIAFVRRVRDKTVLFVYDTKTGKQRPVYDKLSRDAQTAFIPQGTYYPSFDWFPDGHHVAIWAKGHLRRVDMMTGEAEKIPFKVNARHRITKAPRFNQQLSPDTIRPRAIEHVAMAPNGSEMAFTAVGKIWIKQLPDGKPRRLTDGSTKETEPIYSPDSEHIAYVSWQDERGGTLKITDTGNGDTRTLAHSPSVIHQPTFSDDGQHLSYAVSAGDKCIGGYRSKPGIYTVAADGSDRRRLRETGKRPQYGPRGKRIYYQIRHEGRAAIASVDRSGDHQRLHVVARDADVSSLRLSPNGRWVAFKDRRSIHVMPYRRTGHALTAGADSGDVPVHSVAPDGGYALSWAPDGSLHWAVGPVIHGVRMVGSGADTQVEAQDEVDVALQVENNTPSGSIAFVNARLITMEGDEVIENGTVVVEGKRIRTVGPSDEVAVPDNAKIIDASGKTIMPGLVDMHGHLNDCYYANAGLKPQKIPSHYAALSFGITTNYDPYTSDIPSYAVSERRKTGASVGPRLIHTGLPLHGRAGRPDGAYVPIDEYADAERVLGLKEALGGTVIKSYKQPMRSQRQQIVEAAREHSIMADAEGESHFYFNLSMILDGYSALEHNLPVATYYEDVVHLFAHSQTAHTPTLIILFGGQLGENYLYQTTDSWQDPRIQTYVPETTSGYNYIASPHSAPPDVRGSTTAHVADELWDMGIRSVADSMDKLAEADVLVNAGSHGQIQGVGLHWEMWLLAEGEMTNHEVLRTATINGAKTLAIEDQIGSLAPDKLADLIVLEDNPLADIRNTQSVQYSMIGGRLYDSVSMDEIGNYDRPRGQFYWEQGKVGDSGWTPARSHQ